MSDARAPRPEKLIDELADSMNELGAAARRACEAFRYLGAIMGYLELRAEWLAIRHYNFPNYGSE